MIEVVKLRKCFGRAVALDGVSFRVERGERVALLGPNGAGKTTLLRILACYLPPSSGRVQVAGVDPASDSMAIRRITGYLPETTPLYPEMRVGEFLRLRARIKGVGWRDRPKRVREALQRCGLRELEGALLGRLSKGEARRVLVADCLLGAPEVLLLDEPTLGIDAVQSEAIRTLIGALDPQPTMLMATHDLAEARALCTRVLILVHGRLAAGGPARELLDGRRSLAEVFGAVTRAGGAP